MDSAQPDQSDSPKWRRYSSRALPYIIMALLKQQKVLLSRLQKLVRGWPADPSRKGRDLGEFLKQTYVQKFEAEAINGNVSTILVS